MTKIELNVWSITAHFEGRMVIAINNILVILLEELKRLTPEDTKEMLNSYHVEEAKVDGNIVIWSIRNDSDHAIYVEYWVWSLTYNYHKPKGSVFYSGIGNRTFARATDNIKSRAEQIILSELKRW